MLVSYFLQDKYIISTLLFAHFPHPIQPYQNGTSFSEDSIRSKGGTEQGGGERIVWQPLRGRKREGRGIVWYLRKTARGASSPAKPALHIPELETNHQLEKKIHPLFLDTHHSDRLKHPGVRLGLNLPGRRI